MNFVSMGIIKGLLAFLIVGILTATTAAGMFAILGMTVIGFAYSLVWGDCLPSDKQNPLLSSDAFYGRR